MASLNRARLLIAVTAITAAAGRHPASAAQASATAPAGRVNSSGLPVVSPDGARMAFTSTRDGVEDLFVIGTDGTGEVQLTHTAEDEAGVQWTKDGRKVVFSTFAAESSHLHAVDPDGKNQRELATVSGRSPTLSPDGKRLVYMAGTWTETRLMVSNADGSDARQVNDGTSIAWNSHWSPDGERLAFTGREAPKGELAVFVMNADGSERRHLTHIPPEEGGGQWPVWSPDGRQLAIQVNSRTRPGSAHLWMVDVATGEARKLAAHDRDYLDETPSWFPDGKRIAFQSNRTGRMEVWVMNADGSGATQVTGARRP